MRIAERVTTLLCLVMVLLLGMPATAAAEEVAVGPDGRVWSPDLERPLFDPAVRWVPGDTRTAEFWVRNDGAGEATVTVAATVEGIDAQVGDDVVAFRIRGAGGPWIDLAPDGTSIKLGPLSAGASRQFDVEASFDPASGNDSMDRSLEFTPRIVLAGDRSATDGEESDGDGSAGLAGVLPDTGSTVGPLLLVLALALLGIGTGLVAHARRAEP